MKKMKKKKSVLKTKYVLKQNTSCSQKVWELNGNSALRLWFTISIIVWTTTAEKRGAAPLWLRRGRRRYLRASAHARVELTR